MTAQWGGITAKEIAGAIKGILVSAKKETFFTAINTDSRTLEPGQLFWAIEGERFDGHDFASDAMALGAAGMVLRKDRLIQITPPHDPVIIAVDDTLDALGDLARWWRHQHRARVVSVTGSAGKTTTKEMIAEILAMGGRTLATHGNFNNLIGLPITLFRLEKGHEHAVLEMGMNRPGEIARLTKISDPDVGVITNVGMAHLEGVGDIAGVAEAKVEMIENISSKGKIILNADDKLLIETASRFQREYITFGFSRGSTIRCSKFENLGRGGSRFHLQFWDKSLEVRLNVPGLQNVSNAMAAAAVAVCFGTPHGHIVEGLHRFKGVDGRFSLISLFNGATLVDDTYNANPSSLKAALESVAAMVQEEGRLIVGLGDMMELGNAAVSAHREAGRMASQFGAACLITIGEYSQEMSNGAIEGGMTPSHVHTTRSHDEMAEIIGAEMKRGDLILLKGSRKMDLSKVVDNLRVENN